MKPVSESAWPNEASIFRQCSVRTSAAARPRETNGGLSDVCRRDRFAGADTGSGWCRRPGEPLGTPAPYAVAGTGTWRATTFAHLNDHEYLDLLSTGNVGVTGALQVRLGQAGGTFGDPAPDYSMDNNTFPRAVAVGDFNDDDDLDVIVANANRVTMWPGNGSGSLGTARSFDVAGTPSSLAVGDLNGDTFPDIVASSMHSWDGGTGTVSVLLNNAEDPGNFLDNSPVTVNGDNTNATSGVAIGLVNGDSNLDVVAVGGSEYAGNVIVMLGQGDGTFPPEDISYFSTGNQRPSPRSLVLADFDGDMRLDVASAGFGAADADRAGVSVLMGAGDGTFGEAATMGPATQPESIVADDVNGDTFVDLVTADSGGSSVSTLLGNGDGTFAAPSSTSTGTGTVPHGVALGDLLYGVPSLAVAMQQSPSGPATMVFPNTRAPNAEVAPGAVAFDPQDVGTTSDPQTVTVTNSGTAPLTVDSVGLSGAGAGSFMTSEDACSTTTVGVGDSCTVKVAFAPQVTGESAASLDMTDDAAGSPQQVALSGTGVGASPSPSPTPTESPGPTPSPSDTPTPTPTTTSPTPTPTWNPPPPFLRDVCGPVTCEGADLSGMDLSGQDLSGVNFESANLSGANLSGASLHGANLAFADLSVADVSGADVREAILHETDFSNADLTDTDLRNARSLDSAASAAVSSLSSEGQMSGTAFRGAKLHGTLIGGQSLQDVTFKGASLVGTKWAGVTIKDSTLNGATLTKVRLRNATLRDVTLRKATIKRTSMAGAQLRGVSMMRSRQDRVRFTGASLTDVTLQGSHMKAVSFAAARLLKMTAQGSVIERFSLAKAARVKKVSLSGSTITGLDSTAPKTVTKSNALRLDASSHTKRTLKRFGFRVSAASARPGNG